LDENQETVQINVRVPKSVQRFFARLGGGGRGSVSLGLRRLFRTRATMKDGDDAIILKVTEYVRLARELERLRKAVAK
jgi:hypothetical protein